MNSRVYTIAQWDNKLHIGMWSGCLPSFLVYLLFHTLWCGWRLQKHQNFCSSQLAEMYRMSAVQRVQREGANKVLCKAPILQTTISDSQSHALTHCSWLVRQSRMIGCGPSSSASACPSDTQIVWYWKHWTWFSQYCQDFPGEQWETLSIQRSACTELHTLKTCIYFLSEL